MAELYWVTCGPLCFGLVVVRGRVVEAAPVARWCIGKHWAWAEHYWRVHRKARVEKVRPWEDTGAAEPTAPLPPL